VIASCGLQGQEQMRSPRGLPGGWEAGVWPSVAQCCTHPELSCFLDEGHPIRGGPWRRRQFWSLINDFAGGTAIFAVTHKRGHVQSGSAL